MISDNKRREVASNLRESREFISGLPKATLEQNAFVTFDRLLACVNYEKGNIFDYLADLIDRPTCTVSMGVTGHVGVCMRCGAMIETRAAVFNAIEALPTRYCPNCGAEVAGESASRAVTQQR